MQRSSACAGRQFFCLLLAHCLIGWKTQLQSPRSAGLSLLELYRLNYSCHSSLFSKTSVVDLSVVINCTSFAPVVFMRDGQPHAWSRVLNAQTSASLMDGFVARGTFHIPVHFTFITARRRLRVRSTAAKHRAHVGQRKAAERKAAVARRALQAQLNSCGKNQDTFEAHSAGLAAVSLPSAPARPQ